MTPGSSSAVRVEGKGSALGVVRARKGEAKAFTDGVPRDTGPGAPHRWLIAPLVLPAVVASAAVTALVVLNRFSPYVAGTYPVCPSYALTGLYCPGCGALRALHDLTHLNLAGAWDMNPLTVLAIPLVAGYWVAWVRRRATGRARQWLAPPWALQALLALVVVFTVARNIPAFAPWLAP